MRAGLTARLLAAQLLVVAAAVLATWAVAATIGPSIFHDHLTRVTHDGSPEMAQVHAEQAFREANGIAVGVAVVVALVVAAAVSGYVTRRVTAPVTALARTAEQVADGRYDVEVPRPGIGAEFDLLATSFAAMADRLGGVEATRRRMLADLAHEMRTPVATLDAYLEGVEDGVATLDPATVAMLRDQTRRLARLAEDVGAVSRAEEGRLDLHPVRLAPDELVRTAVAAAADRFATAAVRLESDVRAGAPDVEVDPDRFGQVLANLLDNALRHTPPGGRVVVSSASGPDGVTVEVADTGSGVAAEHLPHLFERFYRVDTARDRAHGGSGIGLAIVKAVVEAHGGRVRATSAGPGRGTVVTVTLPAAGTRDVRPGRGAAMTAPARS